MKRARKNKVQMDDQQIRRFVARYGSGETLKSLGEELGVTTPTMAKYLRPHTTIRGRGRVKRG